jgi:aminoglycoside phosphotransferase (APT) family kinase protein
LCIDAILGRHGISGPWHPLKATGLANTIYATRDVVLRIATDHPEAVEDARTESVAAPVARAAGLPVPRLLAFDHSGTIVDRPYSIWERVHGETLGLVRDDAGLSRVWRAVGVEMARLHRGVRECPDPEGWLDQPDRERDLQGRLATSTSLASIDASTALEIQRWIDALTPAVAETTPHYFLHNDIHDMNVMCSKDGALLAVIDWGDAGWGDPALEFAQMPLAGVPDALAGYEAEAPGQLGERAEARIIWDKLEKVIDEWPDDRQLNELRRFVRDGDRRWRL